MGREKMVSFCASNNATANDGDYFAFQQSITRLQWNVLVTVFSTVDGLLIFTTNTVFLSLLFVHRKQLNWRGTIFTLNLAISDLISGIIILAMCGIMFRNIHDFPHFVKIVIQIEFTASILFTSLSYINRFFAQFLAIEKPIFYRNRFTGRHRIVSVGSSWIFVAIYAIFKTIIVLKCCDCADWFNIFEAAFFGALICVSVAAYSYVIYVAGRRHAEKVERKRKITEKPGAAESRSKFWKSVFRDYYPITTAGIHLCVYIASFMPLFCVWVYLIAFDNNAALYECKQAKCLFAFFAWFLRCVIDPILFIAREKTLHSFRPFSGRVAPIDSAQITKTTEYDKATKTYPVNSAVMQNSVSEISMSTSAGSANSETQ